jgi:hypothetical protein
MELFLEREGRFNASRSMIPNNHKCGSMGSKIYSYAVRVEATDAKLTPEGFVLNNELIAEYFAKKFGAKAKKWDAVSCERMASTAARELFREVCNGGADCQCVEVSLTGSNGAKITAKWTVEDENATRES